MINGIENGRLQDEVVTVAQSLGERGVFEYVSSLPPALQLQEQVRYNLHTGARAKVPLFEELRNGGEPERTATRIAMEGLDAAILHVDSIWNHAQRDGKTPELNGSLPVAELITPAHTTNPLILNLAGRVIAFGLGGPTHVGREVSVADPDGPVHHTAVFSNMPIRFLPDTRSNIARRAQAAPYDSAREYDALLGRKSPGHLRLFRDRLDELETAAQRAALVHPRLVRVGSQGPAARQHFLGLDLARPGTPPPRSIRRAH